MNNSLFSQKSPDSVPTGQGQEAVDATPSEQSGSNVRIGTPVWKQFVVNKAFQESNREGIRAEVASQRSADFNNRQVARQQAQPDIWKGANGKLLRKVGRETELHDAADFVDDPVAGPEARRSLWDKSIRDDKREAADSAFMLRDPAFHAQGLKPKDREQIEAEGSMLQETDPRHVELKQKLIADDAYQAKKAELAQLAWDREARARQTEATDPEQWWESRRTAEINANRQPIVQDAQAQHAEADQAQASADEELAGINAKLAQGVRGSDLQSLQSRKAEIEQGKAVIADTKQAADAQLDEVKQAAEAAKQPPQEGVGDFLRGAEVSIKQIPQLFYGVMGLIGGTSEKITGVGKGLKDWGIKGYLDAEEKAAPLQRENDDVQKAWEKTKNGDIGAMVDFIQYGLGYAVGQGIETLAVAGLGGLAGGAATAETGPGAAAGAGVGAIAGAVAKTEAKSLAKRLVEKMIAREALKLAEKQGIKMTAEQLAESAGGAALRKAAAKQIGSTTAVMTNALGMELGSIYPEAVKKAQEDGRELTGTDYARIWGMGIAAGAMEGVADKLGVDLITGKLKGVLPKGRIAAALVGGAGDATVEASTELAQTFLERIGSGQAVTGDEAKGDYLNSAALGAIGGAAMGGGGGFIHGSEHPQPGTEAPAVDREKVNTSVAAIDPQATPADEDEIKRALFITRPEDGADGIAQSVLIERELAQVSMEDNQRFADAEQAVAEAKATGDTKTVKAAEDARDAVEGRAELVRAVLKIASGQELDSLTNAELRALNLEETGRSEDGVEFGTIKPVKGQPAKPAMIRHGDDGSNVLTDEALKKVGEISPRARGRVQMTEAEAIQKAKQRLSTDTQNGGQGDPATGSLTSPLETNASVEFDVPMRDGTVLRVQAANPSAALEEAAAQAPITGQPAIPVQPNEPNNQTTSPEPAPVAPVSVPEVPTPTDGQENAGASDGKPAGTRPAKAKTEAPVAGKAATIAARKRLEKIAKQSPDIAAALQSGPAEATATRISIDPEAIIKDAIAHGMSEKDALARFNAILDEEIKHFAQRRSAIDKFAELGSPGGDFKAWYDAYYGDRWQTEFAGEKSEVARTIYAKGNPETEARWDSMADADKFMEATRMMMQRRDGTVTEQTKLWANISKALVEDLRAMLRVLRSMVKDVNLSTALKADLEYFENELRNVLKTQPRSGDSKTGGSKPATGKTGDGTRGKTEIERPGGTPVDGGTEQAPSAVAGSPLVVGARVEFAGPDGRVIQGTVGNLAAAGNQPVTSLIGGDGIARARIHFDGISKAVPVKDLRVLAAPKVHGEPINGEWTAFSKESGTIGIPRAMMPQVKAEHRSALVQFLKARGVDYAEETVPATSLKPTQTEYSPAKVKKAKAFEGGNRSILISSDNHVVDGHHQWMAALENGEEIPVIRLDAPIRKLLPMAMQMPSASVDGGEILDAPKSPDVQSVENQLESSPEVVSIATPTYVQSPSKSDVNTGQSPVADLSYDDLVRATYTGVDARRKLDDLRPVMQRYVMDFHASGVERTTAKVKEWLTSKGVIGNVGPNVVEILKNLNLADAIAAEKQAIVELNRRENEAKKKPKPQKSQESNVATPAKTKRPKPDTPARRRAMELVYSDSTVIPSIVKIIEQGGKLTPPPAGMLKISEKQRKSRNLTNRQMAERRKWQDYNAYQPKYAFGSDFNGKVAQELHGMLFTSSPTTSTLDDWAGVLGGITNDEAMREVMAELERVAKGRLADNEDPLNRELTAEEERQMMAFDEVNQFDFGRSDLFPQDMEVGDTILMGGETFTLIAKRDGMATLEDGTKFGTQRVPVDLSLWFDVDSSPFSPEEEATFEGLVDEAEKQGYESVHEFNESEPETIGEVLVIEPTAEVSDSGRLPDDPGTPQDGQGQAGVRQPQVKTPASKMDVKNADSRELFSDDGGFSLMADITQDGDKIAAERKAKEDAKAAMDAAQGDMFATPAKPRTTKKSKGPSNIDLLENYFRPGKIVKSYGGDDHVISFDRGDGEQWSVTVQAVDDRDNRGPRSHSTMPSNKDLLSAWQEKETEPSKPTLSAGKQALKDAFSDMVDGLEAAPLTDAGFYSSKGIPREKRAMFMDVADKLYDEGIRTPEAIADALEEVGGGKLRAYSDAVWSVLRSNYPELPQAGDWAGIYSKISEPTSNDSSPGTPLESDRGDAGSPDSSGQGSVRDGRGATRGNGKRVVSDGDRGGNPAPDYLQSDDVPSASERVGSDQQSPDPSPESSGRAAASEQSDGSREPDADGVEAYGRGENDTHDGLVIPASAGTVAQRGVEGVRDVVGIRKSVPSLKVEQAEDVLFVEKRLLENGEPGVLLTNGTGTGKTFSGLGVVKRALDRGEQHVIIVAPSDKVVNDWIDTAKAFFGITDIAQLDGIKDNSPAHRVVVTTYANFGQNMELVRRPWGIVVTDEAHYLSQAKDGTSTLAQKTFKGLTWHHKDGVFNRVSMEMADELAEMSSISASIDSNTRLMNRDDTMDQMYRALRDENEALERRRSTLNEKVQARRAELEKVAAGMKKQDRPKALFLSATPFAYHFSLDYAEGYLFEHGEEPTSNRYNTPSARSRFFMENFGYRMRYNKLTQPENAAATGILERMFSERLKREGSMRGRMLAVPFDYSRDFVLAESMIGTKIDEIFDLVMSDKRFDSLRDSMEIGDYLARRYLLEGLKAKEAVKRIKAHLALGRKVVVFHDYKKGGATNPLRMVRGDQDSLRAYDELRAEVPGFDNLVAILDNLRSPIDVIRAEFPDAGIFNGDVPKLKRRQIVTEFNRSGSAMKVLLGQRASAKEGISLHDTDGSHQRVFIDLGIPGRPTDAIQSEGRIIRLGMQSNGIIEYLTTGTNFERYTFAQTIATRASTAENLAMGENARALLQAFSTGYNDAQALKPSAEQGVGGKKSDAARESGDPFENAVALYYTNQKKTSKNKASEGIDYFATPEPLGFKMVEWAGIRPGERVLEPSGGHGAIARFFPDSTTRHAVEPSYELAGRLALNAPDTKIHQVPFEDYDIVNKFDAIVMNPPFGTAGKTAMDHLEKAVKHLKAGGRLVALIPNGGSMAKRFEKWYENVDGMFLAAEIQLPSVTFERAGTSVSARIVVLDKVKAEDANQQVSRDFTSAATAKEFFDRLKNSSIPERPALAVEKTPAEMMSELLNGGRDAVIPEDKPAGIDGAFSAADFIHTRNGNRVFVARIDKKLSDSEYAAAKSLAKKHGGYYQSYNKGGAIPGFHFPDADSRDGFLGAAGIQDGGLRAAELPSSSYPSFPLRKSGHKAYVNSNTGVLFPDGHEIRTNTQAPNSLPDGGGEIWDRIGESKTRRSALQSAWEASADGMADAGWLVESFTRADGAGQGVGTVREFWQWMRDTLNGPQFADIDPVDTLDALAHVLQLESPVSERSNPSNQLHYVPISKDGTVLAIDNATGKASFGKLPPASEGLQAAPLPEAETFKKRVPVNKALIENAREQQRAFGKNVSSGKLAGFGNERVRADQDVVTAVYEYQKATKSNADAMRAARARLAQDSEGVEAKLRQAAHDQSVSVDAADQMAFQLLIEQRTEDAGDDVAKLGDLLELHMAYRLQRGDVARALQVGYDRNLTPTERARRSIVDAIFTPQKRVEKYARQLTGARRDEFLANAAKERIARVQAELAKADLTIADITGKNSKLKLANSELMKQVLKLKKALDQDIIRMVQKGWSVADIKRRYGKEAAEQAQGIVDATRKELFDKIKAMAAAGMSREEIRKQMESSLKASPLGASATSSMTDADIWAMIGEDFGIPEVIPQSTKLPKARKPKTLEPAQANPLSSDWSRPEFSDGMKQYEFKTADRVGIMQRVEAIRSLAGAMGQIDKLTGDKRAQAMKALEEINQILAKYGTNAEGIFRASKGIEEYGFDMGDIRQVSAVARVISMLDADWIDKASEVLYANMLSGLQTMAVNATAIIPAAWETTVGRGFEMAINQVMRDPMSAQWGESKYIVRAIAPALTRAMHNFKASFEAQHPMFDRDVLAHELDWEKVLGGSGYRFGGSISGRKGDIIRIPMRLLASTDDFNRTLMACVEVGTFAYRMAKAQGLKPGTPEFDRFMAVQVNTPGSMSYELAAVKASRAIFSNPLPGQMDPTTGKVVEVHDLGDVAGWAAASLTKFAAKEHDNLFVKAAQTALRIAFFPFQRTPFNILRQGIRYTINPFSLFDIGLGVVQNSMDTAPDGSIKWKWNAKGRNPELVSRMGKQLQGAVLLMLLAAVGAGEGDDDDQDKPILITGSSPFTPQGRAERDAQMRSGIGPYRISIRRKDGTERFGFNYGRLEPVATTLAATIDLMKSMKRAQRSGKDNYDAASEALGGLVAQAQDKSFMRGISDLVALATNLTAQPELQENRKFQQFLAGRVAMVIPNIIKQPIREADGLYRERSNSFMEEMLYQIAPAGQKQAKIDPYGQESKKQSLTGNPAADSAIRAIDVTDAGTDKVNPVDKMLLRFRDKHPDQSWFPSPIVHAEFKHPKTGQNVNMNGDQLAEFRAQSGKLLAMALRRQSINYENPSELDVEKVKEAVSKARSVAKQALSYKFARQ